MADFLLDSHNFPLVNRNFLLNFLWTWEGFGPQVSPFIGVEF